MKQQIVIIGAGPAGLTAAYELQKQHIDADIIVLEETDHLGGIATTINYKGNHMDMGGHRFFTKSDEVMKLWQEILPIQGKPAKDELLLGETKKTYDGTADPELSDDVFLQRRRVSRIYYLRHFFSYPISVSISMLKNLGWVRLWKIGWSYLYSMLFKRQEKSLEDFYINRFGRKLYRMFFENYTEKIWGRHPSEISPEWGAQRVKGLSILEILMSLVKKNTHDKKEIETSLIEEFYYPKYGPGQMWDTLATRVRDAGANIKLEQKVIHIMHNDDGTYLLDVQDPQGKKSQYHCNIIISSMPVCDFISALENVPSEVSNIATALPYRDFITVGLLCKKLLLINDTGYKTVGNIVPDCWIYVQEHGVKLGRLQIFNNWSPYLVKDLEHTVWIGLEYFCNEGDKFWNMSKEAFIKMAIDELSQISVINSTDVLDSTQVKVKKAYPAYFGTYKDFALVRNYLNSLDNIYCIGRNGQHKYNNMDHSMLTAIETVKVIQGKVSKEMIWKVNTEHEYHEEIRKPK